MRFWLPLAAAAVLGSLVAAGADDTGKKVVDPVTMKTVTVAKDTPTVVVNGTHLYFSDAKGQEGLNRFTLAKIEK